MTHSFSIPETDPPPPFAGPPIHLLPPELLCEIFDHFLPSTTEQYFYYDALYRLQHVCHRWEEIIDDTPTFWRYIDCDLDGDLLNRAIHSSKECELVVECSCRPSPNTPCRILYGTDSESSISGSANAGVVAHCRRWESLTIKYGSEAVIQDYLSLPLPSLRRLSVSRWENGTYAENPYHLVFGGERPRLAELSLLCYRLPWSKLVLDDLRSLEIEEGRLAGSTITDAELLQLLSRTPLLERLLYRDRKEPVNLALQSPGLPLMIKKMDLQDVSLSLVQELCHSVVPHPTGTENIHMRIKCPSEDSNLTFLHDFGRILGSLSPPCNIFRVYLGEIFRDDDLDGYCLTLDLQPVWIELKYGSQVSGPIRALKAILEIFAAEIGWARRVAMKSVHLSLSNALDGAMLNILQHINNAFPEIADFHLRGVSIGVSLKVLRELGASPRSLLGFLTELRIGGRFSEQVDDELCEALEGFLRSRPSIGKWALGGASYNNTDVYKRLQEISPPGTLKLYRPGS